MAESLLFDNIDQRLFHIIRHLLCVSMQLAGDIRARWCTLRDRYVRSAGSGDPRPDRLVASKRAERTLSEPVSD